jgi:hypothetical protein
MSKLIILLLLTSCASHKKANLYTVKYTVREYYAPVKAESPVVKKKPTKKVTKKKTQKIDCAKVFQEINLCMK